MTSNFNSVYTASYIAIINSVDTNTIISTGSRELVLSAHTHTTECLCEQQTTYDVRVDGGKVYVNYTTDLRTTWRRDVGHIGLLHSSTVSYPLTTSDATRPLLARSAKPVLAIVILSVRLSRPGTDSSPGETETPGFYRVIAQII